MAEVKCLSIIDSKLSSKKTSKCTVNVNKLGTYAFPGSCWFRKCIIRGQNIRKLHLSVTNSLTHSLTHLETLNIY